MVVCCTSVCFYEGLVCFLVLKYPPSSFIPSLWISKVQSTISKQCNLILECQVKSTLEFDHNGLVIVILHEVYELLELVNVVINWVLVRGIAVFHMSESFRDDLKGCEGDWKFSHPA